MEIITVLLGTVSKIVDVCRVMQNNSNTNSNINTNNNSNSNNNIVNVSADELVPILALVLHMSLIMGNEPRQPITMDTTTNNNSTNSTNNTTDTNNTTNTTTSSRQHDSYIQDLQHMYNLTKIAEVCIPEHMAVRQDAYVITVASTSIYAMAIGAAVV